MSDRAQSADAAAYAAVPSLRRNFSWTFVGNVVSSACNFGIVMLLAKLGSAEVVGLYALGMAITQPVLTFARLELRAVQVADAQSRFAFGQYLTLRIVGLLVANAGIAAYALAGTNDAAPILLISLTTSIDAVSDIFHGRLQKRERMDRVAISLAVRAWLSLVLLGVTLWASQNIVLALFAMAVPRFGMLVAYDIPGALSASPGVRREGASRRHSPAANWSPRILLGLAWFALPLAIVTTLNAYSANIPRYFIACWCGERELGIFAANAALAMAGRLVVSALGQSASARLARQYAAGNLPGYAALVCKLATLGGLIGVAALAGGLLFGRQVIGAVYRPEYAQSVAVLTWLLAGELFYYVGVFFGVALTAARYFWSQLVIAALSPLVTAAVAWWLVPVLGLGGAALATAATNLCMLAGNSAAFCYVVRRTGRLYRAPMVT